MSTTKHKQNANEKKVKKKMIKKVRREKRKSCGFIRPSSFCSHHHQIVYHFLGLAIMWFHSGHVVLGGQQNLALFSCKPSFSQLLSSTSFESAVYISSYQTANITRDFFQHFGSQGMLGGKLRCGDISICCVSRLVHVSALSHPGYPQFAIV